ncbi:serine racemase VanT catalytic subunit [Cohnella herbarum]|uniref:Alanine racemase n=1 Tax=Cohnella herbarum TaxID=2728023 RepID=A0A7Z2VMI4_9BACL|nr:serine racemase VanT catalytic subunit [Cohnella herbarum]QJD85813.1 serine racemase VanT catalytic subunit [Cohnella herbarum]
MRTSNRAWAEINLAHLKHNLFELMRALPSRCSVMAVVKANAYGHGGIEVAKFLNEIGVIHFAVASIEEAIELRRHGVQGEILILGYTSPDRADDLFSYQLTQTIVSADYGRALDERGRKIKVHVKIDTGMHRLGESHRNTDEILSCFNPIHLRVNGTYSHLSVSDSLDREKVAFTTMQLAQFNAVIDRIRSEGLNPGNVHIQSSYGILNYPDIAFDLARPGIALYGLLSNEEDRVVTQAKLQPVLSLRATVSQVSDVPAHHPVGYGHKFIPSQDVRIATVSIGYADGIPKNLADNGGYVLIRGQRANMTGSICMDQFMVDVTSIEEVRQGDTVTIIGQDGTETITAGLIAKQCGTVTNEIVSRIGSRVERVYVS